MSRVSEGLKVDDSLAHVASSHESQMKDVNVILLFGCTGTGKTSFANMASGGDMKVGKSVRSSTKHLEATKVFQVDDQPVAVIDCPGFDDTYLTETEILRRLAEFLIEAYKKKHKVVGLLYFHRISDTRVGGANFRHMNMFKTLCGEGAFENVVYITNMWSEPPLEDQIHREQELRNTSEFFGEPLVNGAQMARHTNTPESAFNIIRKILGRGQVVTKLQRQLVDDKLPLEETDVGLVIGKDLQDDLRKQQSELNELKAAKEKASGANDQNWLQRLKTQEERTRAKELHLVAQLQALKTNKAKELGSSNQPLRVAPGTIFDSGLSMFQERAANELTKIAEHSDRRFDVYPSSQDEWNKRRDEETAREVKRIKNMTTRSRQRANNDRRTLKSIGCGVLASTGVAMAAVGKLKEAWELLSEIDWESPSTLIEAEHHPSADPPSAEGPAIENVSGSYGASSSLLTQHVNAPVIGRLQEQINDNSQIHGQNGSKGPDDENYSLSPIVSPGSRKQPPGSQDTGVSYQ
ncbi:unnamed protein product [Rhizoctonia solani]|uniref:G domain-containing protein n=1 Tax=Rhizoctonia solani TaxID=456999 RepID=A0A8H3CQ98_9AGAM|nr:unnamed protein product [Rhizoctonia solani]